MFLIKSLTKICYANRQHYGLLLFFSCLILAINSLEAHASGNCAKNYKTALSQSYQTFADPLKYAVKISHNKVKIFPGQWRIKPSIPLGDQQKRMSKKQRRLSKRGLKLIALKSMFFSPLNHTEQEKQILQLADSIIRWRGKDPAFNKRGRYGWLTKRIAADLRVYMGQPPHPALCTGAPFMMKHLYDSTGRFRKRVAFIQKIRPLAHQYAGARFRAFKQAMNTERLPEFAKLGTLETNISLSGLLNKSAKLLGQNTFYKKVRNENSFLQTVHLFKDYTNPPNLTKIAQSNKVSDFISLPQQRPGYQITSQKPLKPNQTIKTISVLKESSAIGRLPFSAKPRATAYKLNIVQQKLLKKSLSAIEAAYYIDHIAQSYEALNLSIFGAIASVRQAHKTHCRCD